MFHFFTACRQSNFLCSILVFSNHLVSLPHTLFSPLSSCWLFHFNSTMMLQFLMLFLLTLVTCTEKCMTAKADSGDAFTLDSVRASLVRQEDTIIFGLIERAKFPLNSPTYHYHHNSTSNFPGFSGSLLDFLFHSTEAIQAKAGRYSNPEENPFFPENLPHSVAPHHTFAQLLHPAAASVNINKFILEMYIHELLPLFVASGDDGNYAQAAAGDLSLLQALSRRIHYGKFAAEAKFRKSPQEYELLIRAQDREALMKLLTSEKVEEMVRKRVEKKAMVFGQEVSLDHHHVKGKFKVDPSVVSSFYQKWVIPLTKIVQVEYFLRRLH